MTFSVEGALDRAPREFPEPDEHGAERLRRLDECLAVIAKAFPGVDTGISLCRLSCALLEGAWRERAEAIDAPACDDSCTCTLCAHLPKPLTRCLDDYDWRRSDGRPLAVKTWPYRKELDSVLTGGWVWTRKMNDSDRDLGLRLRHEDDILVLHEYKRVEAAIEVSATARAVEQRLAEDRTTNGARALICGLYAAYKRSVDEYWLKRHVAGTTSLPQCTPLDKPSYTLLQLMDCLFWHVPPDAELWQEEQLASLVLCRVLNDMTDVRADAVTGEVSNFWLSSMSTHDKALYGACVLALIKYGCMPESHGLLWNTWLMGTTVVWEGLTGRHALWFDGITNSLPPGDDCLLCGIEPNACTGLLTDGVALRTGHTPTVEALGERAALLSARCQAEQPQAWRLFDRELAAFEALHGEWRGDVGTAWEILRRTYIAGVIASLAGGAGARNVQVDSGDVGADLFHALHRPPTWQEDTALLAYMFGCAHPHFLWNGQGFAPTAVGGDWLDG
ncbi:hypothetical protein [Streptomyces sp. NBC_01187]|uniref:hypothetical protein n=1 Tax=Streptomyces sp. NBC_01187 TaxID=2903766 RepID=UPI00386A65D2|nr:hypothetical protein OG220_32855 [Streptomyces sp. NBC_01187]